jgi:hypothetical protein
VLSNSPGGDGNIHLCTPCVTVLQPLRPSPNTRTIPVIWACVSGSTNSSLCDGSEWLDLWPFWAVTKVSFVLAENPSKLITLLCASFSSMKNLPPPVFRFLSLCT